MLPQPGLDWDPFRGLAISDGKVAKDAHGKVTTHFRVLYTYTKQQ